MDRVSLRIGVIAAVAAISVLLVSLTTGAAMGAQYIGKNGVIYSCFKAKGKNKGALRVVPSKRSCRRMRGWRPLSWSATSSSAAGQNGSQGAGGQQGPQGNPGPEGKEGAQGAAGQIEKSVLETVQNQTTQISSLTAQVTDLSDGLANVEGDITDLTGGLTSLEGDVTDLSGELTDLEGTVAETCAQLAVLTDQTDEIISGVSGVELNNALKLINALITFPDLPVALGSFECE